MDYTKIPRGLIYRDRKDIDEFTEGNDLNSIIVENMEEVDALMIGDFDSRALLCLNTAYYICTMIMLEKKPSRRWPEYLSLAYDIQPTFSDKFCVAVLSIVCILLRHYDEQWQQRNEKFICKIEEFVTERTIPVLGLNDDFSSEIINTKQDYIYNLLSSGTNQDIMLPQTEFAPRDIRDENITWDDIAEGIDYVVEALEAIPSEERYLPLMDILDRIPKDKYSEPRRIIEEMANILGVMPTIYLTQGEDYYTDDENSSETEELSNIESGNESENTLKEAQAKNRQLEETIKNYQEKQKGLNPEQAALFGHALAEFCSSDKFCAFATKRKRNDLAPMVHRLFGWGSASVYNKMTAYQKNDREAVASVFDEIWPEFALFVRSIEKRH